MYPFGHTLAYKFAEDTTFYHIHLTSNVELDEFEITRHEFSLTILVIYEYFDGLNKTDIPLPNSSVLFCTPTGKFFNMGKMKMAGVTIVTIRAQLSK
jgi:hypothetical protein